MYRFSLIVIIGLVGLMAFTRLFPVQAFSVRGGNDVAVGKDETVQGSLAVSGTAVMVEGTVNGDIYCAGKSVDISGTVNGDVLCAAQTFRISGNVTGSVRSVSQTLMLGGRIGRNVTVAAQTLTESGSVDGEFMGAGQDVVLSGNIGQDVHIMADSTAISGEIGGNTSISANSLDLKDTAHITGNLDYTSSRPVAKSKDASVSGQIIQHQVQPSEPAPRQRGPTGNGWGRRIASLVLAFAAGLILLLIGRSRSAAALDRMVNEPLLSMGTGLVILFLAPFIIILLTVTLIGIPLAVLAGLLFALAVSVSRVLACLAVGKMAVSRYWKQYTDDVVVITGMGTLIVYLFLWVPVAGWVLTVFSTIWGLGGVYAYLKTSKNITGE